MKVICSFYKTTSFRYLLRRLCFLWVLIFCSFQGKMEMDSDTVKSLFIYNFTKHVNWPLLPEQKFVIGVVGDTAFAEKLKIMVSGKKVSEKDISVSVVEIDNASSCQLLFICQDESWQLKKAISVVGDKNILIVTEGRGLALRGSCINIISVDEKMKFEINEKNIVKAGLRVSNQLLSLGLIVKDNSPNLPEK